MISSDVMRGYNDILILSILNKEDNYGYEISKEIQRVSKDRYSMKEATLYSTLMRLEKNNCISSYKGKETQGKPRTYFTITKDGKDFLKSKNEEWELTKDVINEFFRGQI